METFGKMQIHTPYTFSSRKKLEDGEIYLVFYVSIKTKINQMPYLTITGRPVKADPKNEVEVAHLLYYFEIHEFDSTEKEEELVWFYDFKVAETDDIIRGDNDAIYFHVDIDDEIKYHDGRVGARTAKKKCGVCRVGKNAKYEKIE